MTRHCSSTELLAFLDENDAAVDLDLVREHLELCGECANRLDHVKEDYILIADPDAWSDAHVADIPSDRVGELTELRLRLLEETEYADVTLAELRKHPLETWIEHVARMPNACTAALVRRVTADAREIEEREPKQALALLSVSETIAALLTNDQGRNDALGDVWKERANALTVLGDYPGALIALDRAELFFAGSIVAPFDLAFVAWGRANVYFEMGEYSRALVVVRETAPVFRRFGDNLRATQLQVLEAGILYEQGDIDRASELWHLTTSTLERFRDRITLARVYANIACCRLQRDELAETQLWAARAAEIFEEFGLETEITRTRWALAKVLLRRGDRDALAALAKVVAEFQEKGLETDAAEVRLDIVDELLKREQFSEAAAVARELADTFIRVNARGSAAMALSYLREAAEGMRATPDLMRVVRHVVTHPEMPFIPLKDNDTSWCDSRSKQKRNI